MLSPVELAVPGARSLQPYQPGKPSEELEREYGIQHAVKLASNENPLGPSSLALKALTKAGPTFARYPDGNSFALKRALAERLKLRASQITLGNGSNEILELVARTFVSSSDEVVFSQHAFVVYPLVTQSIGASGIVVPAKNWGHDLEAMAEAVTACTKMVFIANPNNPTGTWVTSSQLEKFLTAMPDHVLVVVDEAYFEYVAEPAYPNCIQWVEHFPNLVVTRTFSKAYGLAGLRVGWGVSSSEIADLMNRVRQPFNVSSAAQTAALAALQDEDHIEKSVTLNAAQMARLQQALPAMGLSVIPSVGNFVCVDVGRSAAQVYEALLHEGVIVRPVDNYGLPNHLRITVGLLEENDRLISALARALGR
ncbi:MAG: histidinol-phosphate transaminase [Gammaproteobacteria bacterium]|nr:histidinol-phosphate transaminase [Gammaproteobacteria bacterium]